MKVIVTRPERQANEWVDALRARGVDAAALPLIAIAPALDPAPVQAAWRSIAERRLVVFVSPNAAHLFFASRPDGLRWPTHTLAASPGPGTTRVLLGLGVPLPCIVEPSADASQFDSESLWEQLERHEWQRANVLVVRGDHGRDWLAGRLIEQGAVVESAAAYRRTAPRLDAAQRALLEAAWEAPRAHLWHFSSSQAIDHLAAATPGHDWRSARALASHPRIAARAQQLGFVDAIEVRPLLDAMVACIQSIGP